MYLLSTCHSGTTNPDNDIRNVISSCVLILAGDGGHNIREIISGLTASVILLKNIIDELKVEIMSTYPSANIWESIRIFAETLDRNKSAPINPIVRELYKLVQQNLSRYSMCNSTVYAIFKNVLMFMANWSNFIDHFYDYQNSNVVYMHLI